MTENLIKDVKKIQQALINKESVGDEFEEKMEAIHKLEEVADYLKDALGRGIEFLNGYKSIDIRHGWSAV